MSSAETFLDQIEVHPDTAALRADSMETLRTVSWALAVRARADGTTCPTWDGLAEATGLSRRSVSRWLAWLVERNLLARTTTPRDVTWSENNELIPAVAQVYAFADVARGAAAADEPEPLE